MAGKVGDPVADKASLKALPEGSKVVVAWPDDPIVRSYAVTYRNGFAQCGPVNMETIAALPDVKIADPSVKDGGSVGVKDVKSDGGVKVVSK